MGRSRFLYGKKDQDVMDFIEETGVNALSLPFFGEFAAQFFRMTFRGLQGKKVFDKDPINLLLAEPFEYAMRAVNNLTQAYREGLEEKTKKGEWAYKESFWKGVDNMIQAVSLYYGAPVSVYRIGKNLLLKDEEE